MMIRRTDGNDSDLIALVSQSDAFYRQMFGKAMDYFDQFNTIDTIEHAVVIYQNDVPVACGCIRQHDATAAEIKRMHVLPSHRNAGLAAEVLAALEGWAKELGFASTVLETSKALVPAVHLYQKHGYRTTEKWGPYVDVEMSVCMRKDL